MSNEDKDEDGGGDVDASLRNGAGSDSATVQAADANAADGDDDGANGKVAEREAPPSPNAVALLDGSDWNAGAGPDGRDANAAGTAANPTANTPTAEDVCEVATAATREAAASAADGTVSMSSSTSVDSSDRTTVLSGDAEPSSDRGDAARMDASLLVARRPVDSGGGLVVVVSGLGNKLRKADEARHTTTSNAWKRAKRLQESHSEKSAKEGGDTRAGGTRVVEHKPMLAPHTCDATQHVTRKMCSEKLPAQ